MKRKKRNSGANIPEFTLCLILLIFMTLPIVNLVGFLAASTALKFVVQDITKVVSHSQSKKEALSKSKLLIKKLKNPIYTGFHKVDILPQKDNPMLTIEVMESNGKSSLIDLDKPIPSRFKDKNGKLKSCGTYSFHLDIPCLIHPFLNLRGIPVIGQTKMIGCPTKVNMCSTAMVECANVLEK